MKKIFVALVCFSLLGVLTGCPKQVNQSQMNSQIGASSDRWGTPNVRLSTAGFNGSPSHQIGVPSNTTASNPNIKH